MWSASIVQKNELITDFYSWVRDVDQSENLDEQTLIMNSEDFLLHGIYNSNILVRTEFEDCIELICEKVTKNIGEKPIFFVLKVLMNHFPGSEGSVATRFCSEYFSLFGALIK